MNRLTKNRKARFQSLPTALLWLALGAGFATVGQAEESLQNLTVTEKAVPVSNAGDLRQEIQTSAQDAAWRTRVSAASKLGVRLKGQHRSYRLASRSPSWQKRG